MTWKSGCEFLQDLNLLQEQDLGMSNTNRIPRLSFGDGRGKNGVHKKSQRKDSDFICPRTGEVISTSSISEDEYYTEDVAPVGVNRDNVVLCIGRGQSWSGKKAPPSNNLLRQLRQVRPISPTNERIIEYFNENCILSEKEKRQEEKNSKMEEVKEVKNVETPETKSLTPENMTAQQPVEKIPRVQARRSHAATNALIDSLLAAREKCNGDSGGKESALNTVKESHDQHISHPLYVPPHLRRNVQNNVAEVRADSTRELGKNETLIINRSTFDGNPQNTLKDEKENIEEPFTETNGCNIYIPPHMRKNLVNDSPEGGKIDSEPGTGLSALEEIETIYDNNYFPPHFETHWKNYVAQRIKSESYSSEDVPSLKSPQNSITQDEVVDKPFLEKQGQSNLVSPNYSHNLESDVLKDQIPENPSTEVSGNEAHVQEYENPFLDSDEEVQDYKNACIQNFDKPLPISNALTSNPRKRVTQNADVKMKMIDKRKATANVDLACVVNKLKNQTIPPLKITGNAKYAELGESVKKAITVPGGKLSYLWAFSEAPTIETAPLAVGKVPNPKEFSLVDCDFPTL